MLAPVTPLLGDGTRRLDREGSGLMVLGRGLASVEMPSLLPPGSEWIALVMRARGGGEAAAWAARHGGRCVLLPSQVAMADEVARVLDVHALEEQPHLIATLKELLEHKEWLHPLKRVRVQAGLQQGTGRA